jgi:hypothetical protein
MKPQISAEGAPIALNKARAKATSITVPRRFSIKSWTKVPIGPIAMLKGRIAFTQAPGFFFTNNMFRSSVCDAVTEFSWLLLEFFKMFSR